MSKKSFLQDAIQKQCIYGDEIPILAKKHKISESTITSILATNNFERESLDEVYVLKKEE